MWRPFGVRLASLPCAVNLTPLRWTLNLLRSTPTRLRMKYLSFKLETSLPCAGNFFYSSGSATGLHNTALETCIPLRRKFDFLSLQT